MQEAELDVAGVQSPFTGVEQGEEPVVDRVGIDLPASVAPGRP